MKGARFKETIVEEVETLNKEPKRGLFPAEFDKEVSSSFIPIEIRSQMFNKTQFNLDSIQTIVLR